MGTANEDKAVLERIAALRGIVGMVVQFGGDGRGEGEMAVIQKSARRGGGMEMRLMAVTKEMAEDEDAEGRC